MNTDGPCISSITPIWTRVRHERDGVERLGVCVECRVYGHLLQDVGGIRARELVDRACTTINNCYLLYIHYRAYDVLNWRETVQSNQQSIS